MNVAIMENFRAWMEVVGTAVDGAGVLIVVLGAAYSTLRFAWSLLSKVDEAYRAYRQALGRAILLGLEFLVAGDIIRTVVVSPTLLNVIALAIIVLIRTFLSVALELELEGRWPWSHTSAGSARPASDRAETSKAC